ncbi:MAG: hypothetical protein KUG72_04320 [Pseudomonadales bacterium]|nr:hypothetical protein [Pseudomonadales bacterium]
MSYRNNPLVGQKLGYAGFFQAQYDAAERAFSKDGFAQHAALQEVVVFELVNTLNAFLSEIADNYGANPECGDAITLSSGLAELGIVSPEVTEICLSITSNGWISSLLNQHSIDCAAYASTQPKAASDQPVQLIDLGKPEGSKSGFWLVQLTELIDRHRDGLVEW